MSAPLLSVEHLTRHFSVRGTSLVRKRRVLRAVDGVSFSLDRGTTFGLVGESGCGKSTLARTLVRLLEPTSGSVRFNGIDLAGLDRRALKRVRKRLQIVFQDPAASLSPRRTIAQTLREPLDVHRIGSPAVRRRRVAELLDIVGLDEHALHRFPNEFSGGQRQRLAIARALASEPDLIVADEPVSALDASVQSQILNLMADLQKRFGVGFVFISHDLAVIQHVSDVVGVMYLGRLVEVAPVDRLFAAPAHPYTQTLLSAVPMMDPLRRTAPTRTSDLEPPSPLDPPSGCPYHPRCAEAMPICRTRPPRTISIATKAARHTVTCHLHDPDAHEA